MRARDVLVFLAGSIVVAAACAAQNAVVSGDNNANVTDAGRIDSSATRDDGLVPTDSFLQDIGIDFGVREASADDTGAAPSAFTVDEPPCVQDASGAWYARKQYPNRTKEDLSRVSVLLCGTNAPKPEGFDCIRPSVAIRDGEVAAFCGSGTATVKIVMPTR